MEGGEFKEILAGWVAYTEACNVQKEILKKWGKFLRQYVANKSLDCQDNDLQNRKAYRRSLHKQKGSFGSNSKYFHCCSSLPNWVSPFTLPWKSIQGTLQFLTDELNKATLYVTV